MICNQHCLLFKMWYNSKSEFFSVPNLDGQGVRIHTDRNQATITFQWAKECAKHLRDYNKKDSNIQREVKRKDEKGHKRIGNRLLSFSITFHNDQFCIHLFFCVLLIRCVCSLSFIMLARLREIAKNTFKSKSYSFWSRMFLMHFYFHVHIVFISIGWSIVIYFVIR